MKLFYNLFFVLAAFLCLNSLAFAGSSTLIDKNEIIKQLSGNSVAKKKTFGRRSLSFDSSGAQEAAQTQKKEIAFNNLLFKSGSAEFSTEESYVQVKKISEALSSEGLMNGTYVVIGHTDSIGDYDYNQNLSMQRAAVVKQMICLLNPKLGGQIQVIGKGEIEPVGDNSTEHGRYQNRRVVIERID